MIDHSLLHPTMTQTELTEGCQLAMKYNCASVCIKPYAVPLAVKLLDDSDVAVGTVVGFPHGNSSPKIKRIEAETACQEGAIEIDMVVNIGRVLAQEWSEVAEEIALLRKTAHNHKALLKVIFENDFLEAQHIIELSKIATEEGADFIKTSTGYGFVKGENGFYSYQGARDEDLKLMRRHAGEHVRIKAAGGIRSLEDLLRVHALGVSRIGATATAAIVDKARKLEAVDRGND